MLFTLTMRNQGAEPHKLAKVEIRNLKDLPAEIDRFNDDIPIHPNNYYDEKGNPIITRAGVKLTKPDPTDEKKTIVYFISWSVDSLGNSTYGSGSPLTPPS
jgi:hypothetical protein